MKVSELIQYRSICAEIQELKIKLNDKTMHGTVSGSQAEFPYIQCSIKVDGVASTEENIRYLTKLDKLKKQKKKIEDFIDSIEDSQTRRIFEYRYLTGDRVKTWQEIAFKIGKYDESYARRKHNKFIKKYKLAENAENDVV